MASGEAFVSDDYDDKSSSKLLKDTVVPDDTGPVSIDSSTNNTSSKGQKCLRMRMWTFSVIIIGLSVMFLMGVCIGFYVRDLQTGGPIRVEEICGVNTRKQGIDYDKLGDLHETLVYYIRGEVIREFVSEHGQDDPVTGSEAEKRLANAALKKFETYKIDSVDVEEYDVVVTNADPNHPNQLEILDQSGRQLQLLVLTNSNTDTGNSSWFQKWKHPHVLFSPAGQVQADLVYGHYGRDTDFMMIQALGVEVKGRVILLRLGKLSLAEKIKNCEASGVQGVILYWEPQDLKDDATIPTDTSYIPFASAATYSNEQTTLWRPSIPCQTISPDQAKLIMSLLHLANNSIPAPVLWHGSLVASYVLGPRKSGSLMVRLSVFNKMSKQRVQNFISTIQGTEELDRYVIVGAPRSSLPGQSQDVVASTSILTQLAHSFYFLHNQHHWKPRRSVKLISWGGAEFSNSGILHHIKTYHNLLDKRAVAYFDLRRLVLGNGSIIANIPPGLHQLIQETTFDVPDPTNAEQTLHMSWKLINERNKNFSQQELIPLESYPSDRTHNPFLHILGIPEVKLQYRASQGSHNSVAAMTSEDLKHHYKFHITVTHILVKSMLVILDNEFLPMNLPSEIRALQSTIWQTSDILEQCFPDIDLYPTAALCNDLMRSAKGLREVSNLFVNKSDKQGMRMVNDISMSFQQTFLVHKNGISHHILYPALGDGGLARAADLCEAVNISHLQDMIREFEETLASVMKRALILFHLSA